MNGRPVVDTPRAAADFIEREMQDGFLNAEHVVGVGSPADKALRMLIAAAREESSTGDNLAGRTALLSLANWCRNKAIEFLESAADPNNTMSGAIYDRDRAEAFEALARISDDFMEDKYPVVAGVTP